MGVCWDIQECMLLRVWDVGLRAQGMGFRAWSLGLGP